jgi:hypothetical protein
MGAVQVSRARDDDISRLGPFRVWNLSIDSVLSEIKNIAFHRHDRSLSWGERESETPTHLSLMGQAVQLQTWGDYFRGFFTQSTFYFFLFWVWLLPTHCTRRGLLMHLITIHLAHTHTHTIGRTFLDEWSAHAKTSYLTTHNPHKRQTSMPPVGFEPAIPASERPQAHALDRAATGIGRITFNEYKL